MRIDYRKQNVRFSQAGIESVYTALRTQPERWDVLIVVVPLVLPRFLRIWHDERPFPSNVLGSNNLCSLMSCFLFR
jgi:hypothetical protein